MKACAGSDEYFDLVSFAAARRDQQVGRIFVGSTGVAYYESRRIERCVAGEVKRLRA